MTAKSESARLRASQEPPSPSAAGPSPPPQPPADFCSPPPTKLLEPDRPPSRAERRRPQQPNGARRPGTRPSRSHRAPSLMGGRGEGGGLLIQKNSQVLLSEDMTKKMSVSFEQCVRGLNQCNGVLSPLPTHTLSSMSPKGTYADIPPRC